MTIQMSSAGANANETAKIHPVQDQADSKSSLAIVDGQNLPAAPATYRARCKYTGNRLVDAAIAEMRIKPWMQILQVEYTGPIPGDFPGEFARVTRRYDNQEIEAKEYVIQSLGMREFYRSNLRIAIRALHLSALIEWMSQFQSDLGEIPDLRCVVEFRAFPGLEVFTLDFRDAYDSMDTIGSLLLCSQSQFPL